MSQGTLNLTKNNWSDLIRCQDRFICLGLFCCDGLPLLNSMWRCVWTSHSGGTTLLSFKANWLLYHTLTHIKSAYFCRFKNSSQKWWPGAVGCSKIWHPPVCCFGHYTVSVHLSQGNKLESESGSWELSWHRTQRDNKCVSQYSHPPFRPRGGIQLESESGGWELC